MKTESFKKKTVIPFYVLLLVFALVIVGLFQMSMDREARYGTVTNIDDRRIDLKTSEGIQYSIDVPSDVPIYLSALSEKNVIDTDASFDDIRIGDDLMIKDAKDVVSEVYISPRE